jgi:hypothetical protein
MIRIARHWLTLMRGSLVGIISFLTLDTTIYSPVVVGHHSLVAISASTVTIISRVRRSIAVNRVATMTVALPRVLSAGACLATSSHSLTVFNGTRITSCTFAIAVITFIPQRSVALNRSTYNTISIRPLSVRARGAPLRVPCIVAYRAKITLGANTSSGGMTYIPDSFITGNGLTFLSARIVRIIPDVTLLAPSRFTIDVYHSPLVAIHAVAIAGRTIVTILAGTIDLITLLSITRGDVLPQRTWNTSRELVSCNRGGAVVTIGALTCTSITCIPIIGTRNGVA